MARSQTERVYGGIRATMRGRRGFTLIEILVASTIFVILLGSVYYLFAQAQEISRVARRRIDVFSGVSAAFERIAEDFELMEPLNIDSGQIRFASTGSQADNVAQPFLELVTDALVRVAPASGNGYSLRTPAMVRYYLFSTNLEGPVLIREVLLKTNQLAGGETVLDPVQELAHYIQDVRVEYLRRDVTADAPYAQVWQEAPSTLGNTTLWPASPTWAMAQAGDWAPRTGAPVYTNNVEPPPRALRITFVVTDATQNPARTPAVIRVIPRTFFLRVAAAQ